jgi:hypothetical protein
MGASHKQAVASKQSQAVSELCPFIYRWMPCNGMEETQITAAATLQNFFTAGNKGGHHLIPNMAVTHECQGRDYLAPRLYLLSTFHLIKRWID